MKNTASKYTTPILIICFNRPQYIERQLSALRKVKPTSIFISCDGPRQGKNEESKVEEVKQNYLEGIDWDCDVKTNFSTKNLGCFQGPKNAMSWFFENVPQGVILEDDIVPNKDFFWFCEDMLATYKNNTKIISISGCNFGYHGNSNEYMFSNIMNMWGWATWADRFNTVDFSMTHWSTLKFKYLFLYNRLRQHVFDFDFNWFKYWENIFNKTIKDDSATWWDYQFIYHQLQHKQLTVYPKQNLIENIGFDLDSTHTIATDNPINNLKLGNLSFPLIKPKTVHINKDFHENYLKPIWALYTRPNWKYYIGKIIK